MPRLSERLRAVADLVGEGLVLADVGTDHGYVPVYLCQQRRIPRAIAMDIRPGPLARAREHILQYGLQAYIETRLSDGVGALSPGEADAIVIAGMGGGLAVRILSDGQEVCHVAKELILQPQSELYRVRSYLAEHGYAVDAEEMVAEDGKFYPMMRVHWTGLREDVCVHADASESTGKMTVGDALRTAPAKDMLRTAPAKNMLRTAPAKDMLRRDVCLYYGERLLAAGHPVLGMYLEQERRNLEQIREELAAQPQTGQIAKRMREVDYRLECNETACAYYR